MAKAKAAEQETAAGTARTARKSAGNGGSAAVADGAKGNGRSGGDGRPAAGGAAAAAGVKGRAGATTKRPSGGSVGPVAAAGKGPGGAPKPAAASKPDLKADLRDFASGRPSGWNHDDWLGFLDHLQQRGHDTSDHEHVGRQLEQERLALALEGVDGLGPRRVQALVGRFGTLYSLRQAGVDELAQAGLPRAQAEKVAQAIREG
jgi:hypothetical protein